MNKLKVETDPRVPVKFAKYPKTIRPKIKKLRDLIVETAEECAHLDQMEETLKWGEPSYLVKKGSTIRIDWKSKSPDQYAMYFKCTSKLVPTFKEVFGETFTYENNRAILFTLDQPIPRQELMQCIRLALEYHTVKHLPRLGL